MAGHVWLVIERLSYEGDRVVGAFASEERANRYIATQAYKRGFHHLTVQRLRVRGGEHG